MVNPLRKVIGDPGQWEEAGMQISKALLQLGSSFRTPGSQGQEPVVGRLTYYEDFTSYRTQMIFMSAEIHNMF